MTDMTDSPDASPAGDRSDGTSTRWRVIAGAVAVVIVAVVVGVLLLADDDDDGDGSSATTVSATDTTVITDTTALTDTTVVTDTTETSGAPTTTEPPATTEAPATTVEPPAADTATAVWPWVDTSVRYTDPVEAATGFAVDYLGFTDPIVGEFLAGDARSGEVEIRTFATGPATTVLVRQLDDDDSWWILGAVAQNITIDEPVWGAEVTSPLTVTGSALAFEGTVDVELRADGNGEPILEGFVTGSGGPEPGPFSETFEFASPGDVGGALVLLSRSSEDGSVLEAGALRIFYR